MNWISIDIGKVQRNCRQLFICFILLSAVTNVLCQIEPETQWSERKNSSAEIILRTNRVQWKHHFKDRLLSDSILTWNSKTIRPHNKQEYQTEVHSKLKKYTQNHSKSRKNFAVSQETAKRNNFNYSKTEKKYFDYFPTEDTPEKLMPQKADKKEEVQVVVLLLNDTDTSKLVGESPGRVHGITRSKRENPRQETYVRENYFLAGEQENKLPFAILPNKINQERQYYSEGTSNDPWNNRFVRPPKNLNPPVSPFYRPASFPFLKYPIPGIYHNTGTPTGNYPILIPSLSSRFGADDDRVIWEIRYVGGATSTTASSGSVSGNRVMGGSFTDQSRHPQTTTRAPQTTKGPEGARTRPPPLIHRENRVQENSDGNRQPSAQRPSNSPQRPAILPDIPNTVQEPARRSTAEPTIIRTTPRTITKLPAQSEPSQCVWAIVSCCSPNSLSVRYSCFEQMGCHGAFWGYNPCADNLQDAAFGVAESFYEK